MIPADSNLRRADDYWAHDTDTICNDRCSQLSCFHPSARIAQTAILNRKGVDCQTVFNNCDGEIFSSSSRWKFKELDPYSQIARSLDGIEIFVFKLLIICAKWSTDWRILIHESDDGRQPIWKSTLRLSTGENSQIMFNKEDLLRVISMLPPCTQTSGGFGLEKLFYTGHYWSYNA